MFDIEYVRCDLCGAENWKPVLEYTRAAGLPAPLQIVRCNHCGLVYLNPRPTMEAYRLMYEGGEFYQNYQSRVSKFLSTFSETYRVIERYKPGKGWLLELGCATGEFIKVGQERGWQVLGLDVSPSLAEIGKTQYDVEIVVGSSIEEVAFPSEHFDVVYASHVLEHLPSPATALREIFRVLKPGGLVIVHVPNEFEDLLYIFFRWLATNRYRRNGATVVDHVFFFSPQTIARMVEQAGFSRLELSTWRERNRRNLLDSRYPAGGLVKHLLFALGGFIGRGPNIEIIASKPLPAHAI